MHKVNTNSATPAGEFTDGDEQQAIEATSLNAAWFNSVQRELCNIVTGMGNELSLGNDSQILDVLRTIGIAGVLMSTGNISNSPWPGSKVIVHSAADFAIQGEHSTGSIAVIIPRWASGSPDYIDVSYGGEYNRIYKYTAFVGIFANDTIAAGQLVGFPIKMAALDGSLYAPSITTPKLIDTNIVQFENRDPIGSERLAPWQTWQLKSNWANGQVKRVLCTNAAEGGTPILTYRDASGHYRNVNFYPYSFRELVCVGEYSNGVDTFALLLTNGES